MNAIAPLRAFALAALLLPSLAMAQPAPTQASTQPGAPVLDPSTAADVEQRISALKARLGITPVQEASWDAFAKTMRDNTADTDTLFAQRVGSATSMTASENMHSYAQIARAYADDTERLSTAFDSLYAGLSDQQRAAADTLFREQPADQQKPAQR
jgi:periplasmic protein CpxP/Spy